MTVENASLKKMPLSLFFIREHKNRGLPLRRWRLPIACKTPVQRSFDAKPPSQAWKHREHRGPGFHLSH